MNIIVCNIKLWSCANSVSIISNNNMYERSDLYATWIRRVFLVKTFYNNQTNRYLLITIIFTIVFCFILIYLFQRYDPHKIICMLVVPQVPEPRDASAGASCTVSINRRGPQTVYVRRCGQRWRPRRCSRRRREDIMRAPATNRARQSTVVKTGKLEF